MRRIAWLFLIVLGSAIVMHAQNSMKLSGTVCNSACVTQVSDASTCDRGCTDTSGKAVLVDDSGNLMKIAEQDQGMCQSHMGKHVKMTARRMERPAATASEAQREDTLRIMEIEDSTP
jgi:hypothetical protein